MQSDELKDDEQAELNKIVDMILHMNDNNKETLRTYESMLVSSYNPDLATDGKSWFKKASATSGYWTKINGNPYVDNLIRHSVDTMKGCVGSLLLTESSQYVLARKEEIGVITKNLNKWLTKFTQDATKNRLRKHASEKYIPKKFNLFNGFLFINGALTMGDDELHHPRFDQYLTPMINYKLNLESLSMSELESSPLLANTNDSKILENKFLVDLMIHVFKSKQQVVNIHSTAFNTEILSNWFGELLGKYVAFINTSDLSSRIRRKMFASVLENKRIVVVLSDNDAIWTPKLVELINLKRQRLVWCFLSEHPLEFDEAPRTLHIAHHQIKHTMPNPQELFVCAYKFFLKHHQDAESQLTKV